MSTFFIRLAPKNIGWEPYLYLVFLGFMFFQPLFDPEFGRLDWLLTLALIAVFLPVYLGNFAYGGRRAFVGIWLIALLGVVGMFVNTGSSSFFIYAAAGAPHVVAKPRQAALFIAAISGFIALSFVTSAVPLPDRLWAFLPALIFVPSTASSTSFKLKRTGLTQSCDWLTMRLSGLPKSPNVNASPAICTICWGTRSRASP